MNFDVLGTSMHQGPVTGLDICIRKPLIASCSTDKSVRLWNYNDRTCELTKWFADEIFSIAIHPTGLLVSMCACAHACVCVCVRVRAGQAGLWVRYFSSQSAPRACVWVCAHAHGGRGAWGPSLPFS